MTKSARYKILTGVATATLAVASLFNVHQRAPITRVNNDPNIVYIYNDAMGREVIGVLDNESMDSITMAKSKNTMVVKTSPFVVMPPEDITDSKAVSIQTFAPPENPTYLPIIIRKQSTNWPANYSRTGRWRPAPGGVSIGHPDTTAGTLGGRICFEGNCNCFISNAHVMGGLNGAQIGDSIYQPGKHDGGGAGDEIGKIVAMVSPRKDVTNVVDAAIACGSETTVYPEIYGIGRVDNVYPEPYIGMTATKCGRTTACTTLTLVAKDVTFKVGYLIGKTWKSYTFSHQMLWSGVSAGGDSGSEIVTDNLWDSLLFAGNDDDQVMGNDPDYIFQAIPGAYLPGMQRGLAYP